MTRGRAAAASALAGALLGIPLLIGPFLGAAWVLAGRPASPGRCGADAALQCLVDRGLPALGVVLALVTLAAGSALIGVAVLTVGLVRLVRRPPLDRLGVVGRHVA